MASALQPAPNPRPVPLSRSSTGNLSNMIHRASFERDAALGQTPASNHNSYVGYSATNAARSATAEANAPLIYSAVYSGISVYEMQVGQCFAMRRRADSWLNATQILKIAGVDKGKRTKILEKEILIGEHEKVQGGYGKYQGTWINYDRGLQLCHQYGVEDLLRPLLEYDMGQDGVSAAGQGKMDTPTKEQAMAAQRKRLYQMGTENKPNPQSSNGTFFKNISETAVNAVAAMGKARIDPPALKSGPGRRVGAVNGGLESSFPSGSQQSNMSFSSSINFGNTIQPQPQTLNNSHGARPNPSLQGQMADVEMAEPPRKRMRPISSNDNSQMMQESFDMEGAPTEPNESFVYQQHEQLSQNQHEGVVPLKPLEQPNSDEAVEKQQLLTSLFLDLEQTDFSKHPALLRISEEDMDIPLDATSHTALHWASTLAHIPLLRSLIAKGASIYRVNGAGESALIRACVVTNNFDSASFPDLLEMLGPTIEMTDGRGRTVLHHIAVSSAVHGRGPASRYYLESLLEFVVRQGSPLNSQQNSFAAGGNLPNKVPRKSIGLARFMSEIVNARDKSGDTALNIAARIGNRNIIRQLIEVGADAGIPNRAGLTPADFGIGVESTAHEGHKFRTYAPDASFGNTISRVVGETSREIMSSISSLLSQLGEEFGSETQEVQKKIDSTHIELREASAQLGEERRRLETLKKEAFAREEGQLKIRNLQLAIEDEHAHLSTLANGPTDEITDAFEVNPAGLPAALTSTPPPTLPELPQQQLDYLSSLAHSSVLQARLDASRSVTAQLDHQCAQLKTRNATRNEKYRKLVSLCTGVPEAQVDKMVAGLLAAVESESGPPEMGRVREFLLRIEGRAYNR
ncbi:MAG: transcriptional regulator swi6 [Trizodia sp. TS-e1964]|nr:MAG: transcriptional regulator swi6 [Trizodia sp. TS-e1964]